MKSSFKNVKLTSAEIGRYIKNHGGLQDVGEPCVYLPIIKNNNYHYFEKKSENPETIKSPLACGLNKNNKKYLPNSVFVFVNDDSTNAIATKIGSTPIIGIYTGSIADIEHNANLMIGTLFEQDNFPISLFKRKNIYVNSNGVLTVTSKDSLLGYKDERILSYLVSECALRFLVLHEIGHHIKGHVSDLEKNNNFVLLKATDKMNSSLEHEADLFAASKLAEEYGLVLSELKRHRKDLEKSNSKELELLALSIIILAMTLPFSILYQPDSNDAIKDDIESTIAYREIMAIIDLISELYNNKKCKNAVIWDLCQQNLDESKNISNEINIKQVKSDRDITPSAFLAYLRETFINCKRLYYQVNKIYDIDFYLENYMKVLSYIKDELSVIM